MAKEKILLLGGGGHCKSVIEAIESQGRYSIAGILDQPGKTGQQILGYPVLGSDSDLYTWIQQVPNALVTVGQLSHAALRIRLYTLLKEAGATLPTIVAATARVSVHASISEGTVVLHHTLVNAEARVGANVIINSGALIEHNALIGNHSHISTGAIINGDCQVGSEVFIGSGAVLRNGIHITDKVVIGAGAVVVKDCTAAATYAGNPAKQL